MKNDEATIYCEYCKVKIIEHRNTIAIILSRRENGIGVECDDCWDVRTKKERELHKTEGFPEWIKSQHRLLKNAVETIEEYLDSGGSHFFPIEYDCHDLDTEIKDAKGNINFIRKRIENVFHEIINKENN